MLTLPTYGNHLRLLSIDPGTDTLGTCVFDVDLAAWKVTILDAFTYRASRAVIHDHQYQESMLTHGDRHARLEFHKNNVGSILRHFDVHRVASESAFMGMRAQAFEALVECVSAIRHAVWEYNPSMQMEMISPTAAKKAVQAKPPRKKPEVEAAVLDIIRNPRVFPITYQGRFALESLDEHTMDAIAVGYHDLLTLYQYTTGQG